MPLTADQKDDFLKRHLPHRLCLLTTFRDRQAWFKERIEQPDCDLLRVAKDSALLSIRMFVEFLGLKRKSTDQYKPDDVFVEMLGGEVATLQDLSPDEKRLILGVYDRANKEFAHLTSTFNDQFNTAKAIVDATCLIERLLHEKLYKVVGQPFPTLAGERRISNCHWQFVDGPVLRQLSTGIGAMFGHIRNRRRRPLESQSPDLFAHEVWSRTAGGHRSCVGVPGRTDRRDDLRPVLQQPDNHFRQRSGLGLPPTRPTLHWMPVAVAGRIYACDSTTYE